MEQQTELPKSVFWQSRIECITAASQWALAAQVNEFYASGRWIVATQTFPPQESDDVWTAFVYYKVRG